MTCTYEDIVSICDAHGICLPVDCVEMVMAIVDLATPTQGADARPVADSEIRDVIARLAPTAKFAGNHGDRQAATDAIRMLATLGDALAVLATRDAAPSDPKLDKRAQVGNARFGVGVKWSTVIGAAQRHHDYMTTPEKESERIAKGKAFLDVLTSCGTAELSRDSVIEECAKVVDSYADRALDCDPQFALDLCSDSVRALKSTTENTS